MLLLAPYCSATNAKAFFPLFFDNFIILKKKSYIDQANNYTTIIFKDYPISDGTMIGSISRVV